MIFLIFQKNVKMKHKNRTRKEARMLLLIAFISVLLPFQQLSAQARAGGNRPAANKPAANKPAANKPAANKSAANKTAANKPDVNRSNSNKPDLKGNNNEKRTNINNSGNTTNNISGNKVNIDNSKKNVNINVDNSKDIHVNNNRNTVVRRNTRPYSRPPYVYGGYRYRCYHPYYYHPYRPFVWGPRWHPWGFFIATLATTAIIVSIVDNDMDLPGAFDMASNAGSGFGNYPGENQLVLTGPAFYQYKDYPEFTTYQSANNLRVYDGEYYYDEGVFYLKGNGGYTVVSAPIGAKIKTLPAGYETVSVDDAGAKNYYYGGVFYEKSGDGYKVVAPLAGTVVEHVSEGGEEVKMGDVTYIKMGETYFQPIQEKGKNMYEVADVEADK